MTVKTEIADRLRATLAKELRQDVNAITSEHTLRDDLGLNSLDAIELMFKIEEEFDLSIPDEDMQKLATVGDVVAYLERRLNPAPSSPAAVSTPKTSAGSASAKPASKASPPRKRAVAKPAKSKTATSSARTAGTSSKKPKAKGTRRHA
jgi:acyl carrier protein